MIYLLSIRLDRSTLRIPWLLQNASMRSRSVVLSSTLFRYVLFNFSERWRISLWVWNIILGCGNLSKTPVSNWSFRRVVNPLLANSKDCLGFWKVGRVIDLAYPLLTSPLSQWQPCRTGMCHDVATNRFASRSPKAHAINLCNNLICDNNCHSVLHIDRWENRIILKDKRDHLICQPLQTP